MNTRLYDFARGSFRVMFGTLWRLRVYGAENVPASGPLIVACNHVSYVDPPLLGTACPRRIQYMAKAQLFQIPVLGPLIGAVGAYPVDREGSASAAIKRSVEVLRQGGTIGIFPEGTRNREGTAPIHHGVGLLASIAGAPVVPARVDGTKDAARLHPLRVYFGPPMALPAGRKASREETTNFSAEVMRAIRSLPERFDRT